MSASLRSMNAHANPMVEHKNDYSISLSILKSPQVAATSGRPLTRKPAGTEPAPSAAAR
jgi:hypothetical protein